MKKIKIAVLLLLLCTTGMSLLGLTPVPTPFSPLKVEYKCVEVNIVTDQIRFALNIVNPGPDAIDLHDVSIRYYFTQEGSGDQTFHVDYAAMGSSQISGTFTSDSLLIEFGDGAGILEAGKETGEILCRFAKNDWSSYSQEDDYSFDPSKTILTEHEKVTLYISGYPTWGFYGQNNMYSLTVFNPENGALFFKKDMVSVSGGQTLYTFPAGTSVTLMAMDSSYLDPQHPGCGWELGFGSWEGDFSGSSQARETTIVMDSDKSIIARFLLLPYPCSTQNTPPPTPIPTPSPTPCDFSNVLPVYADKYSVKVGDIIVVNANTSGFLGSPSDVFFSETDSGAEPLFEQLNTTTWKAVRTGVSSFKGSLHTEVFCQGAFYFSGVSGTSEPVTVFAGEPVYVRLSLDFTIEDYHRNIPLITVNDIPLYKLPVTIEFPLGTQVDIKAYSGLSSPQNIYCPDMMTFLNWEGDWTGEPSSDTGVLLLDGHKKLNAHFSAVIPMCPQVSPPPHGDVELDPVFQEITKNNSIVHEVLVNSGSQIIAAYGMTFSYNPDLLEPDASKGNSGVEAGSDGFLSAVNSSTPGTLICTGFDVTGKGPGYSLDLLHLNWIARKPGYSRILTSVDNLTTPEYSPIGYPRALPAYVNIRSFNLGDVNGNGVIDIVDALIISQVYVGIPVDGYNSAAGDVNCSGGEPDIVDALIIAQYYVGLCPPPECR